MLKQTDISFNKTIEKEAIALYGFSKSNTTKLNGFESYVYECEKNNKYYILKITHSIRRTKNNILGELEFVDFLYENEVNVKKSINSIHDRKIEVIQSDDSEFYVYGFEKAEGIILPNKNLLSSNLWNESFFEKWGQTTGKFHEISKKYTPSCTQIKRQEWFQDELFQNIERLIPIDQSLVLDKIKILIDKLRCVPTIPEMYGLTHSDYHPWNICLNGDEIVIFDFDCCEYYWYVNDIVVALYYSALFNSEKNKSKLESFSKSFLKSFLKGYRRETYLNVETMELIPDLLKLRKMLLYTFEYKMNINAYEDEKGDDYMKRNRRIIENELPVIDIDFTQL